MILIKNMLPDIFSSKIWPYQYWKFQKSSSCGFATTQSSRHIEMSNDPVLQILKWRTTPSSRLLEMSNNPVLQFWKWQMTPLSRIIEMSDDPVWRISKSRMTPLLPGRKIRHDPVPNFPAPFSHKFWPVPKVTWSAKNPLIVSQELLIVQKFLYTRFSSEISDLKGIFHPYLAILMGMWWKSAKSGKMLFGGSHISEMANPGIITSGPW